MRILKLKRVHSVAVMEWSRRPSQTSDKLKTAENPQEALAETGLAVPLQHIVHSNDAQRQPTWKNHLKLTLPATESQKLTTRLCKATFAYARNGFEKNNFCGRENV